VAHEDTCSRTSKTTRGRRRNDGRSRFQRSTPIGREAQLWLEPRFATVISQKDRRDLRTIVITSREDTAILHSHQRRRSRPGRAVAPCQPSCGAPSSAEAASGKGVPSPPARCKKQLRRRSAKCSAILHACAAAIKRNAKISRAYKRPSRGPMRSRSRSSADDGRGALR